ncbi:MAG TPA: hypothetical protein PL028_07905 [Bacteroidales bacterium]|jgi:opacity protein-like surface antigen|nr:hypothetical protein [bacterium]HOT89445.1 hypothetical protein [Bacteroidales bacterium]
MKKINTLVVGAFCALLLTTSAFSADTTVKASSNSPVVVTTTPATGPLYLWNQPKVDDHQWTFSIGGGGVTGLKSNSGTTLGLDLSVGYTAQLLLPFEIGIRQGIGYSSFGKDTTLLTTKVYADWTLLRYKKVDVFAGGNFGPTYGNTPLLWSAAPEVGAHYWFAKNVGIEGRVEFPFDIGKKSEFRDTMNYVVGLKVKL